MRRLYPSVFSGALLASALVLAATAGHASPTPEEKCLEARAKAAGKYANCQQKVMAAYYGGTSSAFEVSASRCRERFAAVWSRLQQAAAGTGSTCDHARFADNGNGTVTDNLTALQWEKKTNDGGIHDKDNAYSWSTTADLDRSDADGTAHTTFLALLNAGGCFAGQCGWRLPTLAELQTLLTMEFPCTTSPCIDPFFGPTIDSYYWTSTTNSLSADYAWLVAFDIGFPSSGGEKGDFPWYARAVRGGL